jgi:hypothetical protein
MKWVEDGRDHDVVGLTLAGVPAVVTGSNGQVACAPTATDMDLIDQIVLELDPRRPECYRVVGERSARFWGGAERPVWSLLEARPPHLLSPRFASYDDLLLSAVSEVIREMRAAHEGDLKRATWDARARNRRGCHTRVLKVEQAVLMVNLGIVSGGRMLK